MITETVTIRLIGLSKYSVDLNIRLLCSLFRDIQKNLGTLLTTTSLLYCIVLYLFATRASFQEIRIIADIRQIQQLYVAKVKRKTKFKLSLMS
jgi:hypothetical protein